MTPIEQNACAVFVRLVIAHTRKKYGIASCEIEPDGAVYISGNECTGYLSDHEIGRMFRGVVREYAASLSITSNPDVGDWLALLP